MPDQMRPPIFRGRGLALRARAVAARLRAAGGAASGVTGFGQARAARWRRFAASLAALRRPAEGRGAPATRWPVLSFAWLRLPRNDTSTARLFAALTVRVALTVRPSGRSTAASFAFRDRPRQVRWRVARFAAFLRPALVREVERCVVMAPRGTTAPVVPFFVPAAPGSLLGTPPRLAAETRRRGLQWLPVSGAAAARRRVARRPGDATRATVRGIARGGAADARVARPGTPRLRVFLPRATPSFPARRRRRWGMPLFAGQRAEAPRWLASRLGPTRPDRSVHTSRAAPRPTGRGMSRAASRWVPVARPARPAAAAGIRPAHREPLRPQQARPAVGRGGAGTVTQPPPIAEPVARRLRHPAPAATAGEAAAVEQRVTRSVLERLERTVRIVVQEKLRSGSPEMRRLADRMHTDLYDQVILERERLGRR